MSHYSESSNFDARKRRQFIMALVLDILGAATYLLPIAGEAIDLVFAPIYGLLIFIMFKQRPGIGVMAGVGGLVEEILPGTDFIPSALIAWTITYKISGDKTYAKYQERQGY